MSYYSVLAVTPTNQDWVANYVVLTNKMVAKHGGQYLARTSNHEQLEGRIAEVSMRIIIQWPSRQAALNFMADPAYLPQLKARSSGSVSEHFLIEGEDELK